MGPVTTAVFDDMRQPHPNRRDELRQALQLGLATGRAELAIHRFGGAGRRCEYRRVGSVLVVIGGLPATGKSTIATALARRTALLASTR